jgi:hypothetical protein
VLVLVHEKVLEFGEVYFGFKATLPLKISFRI